MHAALTLAGHDDGFRATLCRCGQRATGRCTWFRCATVRHVHGDWELCAGTGRTVARITEAKLCRCGESKNKPFCDLSHLSAAFVADGA